MPWVEVSAPQTVRRLRVSVEAAGIAASYAAVLRAQPVFRRQADSRPFFATSSATSVQLRTDA
jgi:hypothetical protein